MSEQYWGCSDKMSEANLSPAETLYCQWDQARVGAVWTPVA